MNKEELMHVCKQHVNLTLRDYFFVTQKPSIVAIAVVSASFKRISLDLFDERERRRLFSEIFNALKIESNPLDMLLSQKRLLHISNDINIKRRCTSVVSYKNDRTHLTSSTSSSGNSSPICVSVRGK